MKNFINTWYTTIIAFFSRTRFKTNSELSFYRNQKEEVE